MSEPLKAVRVVFHERSIPGAMTFVEAGEHKIRLRVKHAVEKKVSEQPIRVDSTLFFFVEPHHSKYQMTPFFFERSVSQPYNMLQRYELQ